MEYTNEELFEQLKKNVKILSKLENYDTNKFLYSLVHLTTQLIYFYDVIAKGGNADRIKYRRENQSLEHKLVYINLGRGFPKEIMDGHWCYVLKDMNLKLLVIPTTSLKDDSIFNELYDMDIQTKGKYKNMKSISRLSLSDMRVVDAQRIDKRKPMREVITERNKILRFVKKRILD